METVTKIQDVTFNDLPWKIEYSPERCTMCGSCVAACTFKAIEPGVERRSVTISTAHVPEPTQTHRAIPVIRQKNSAANFCRGCGMCEKVCPNRAIRPVRNDDSRLNMLARGGGNPIKRGGRNNLIKDRTLDKIVVGRISQMTDPSLDSERHTFDILAPFGRVLLPGELPFSIDDGELKLSGWTPPVRWIYPVIFSDMSVGALSTRAWEAVCLATAYLNERYDMPVRMCSGEGGMPVQLMKSDYLKYMIIQIASGHFGWNRIIKAMPHMKVDPAGILIKIGQGAKPGDGGLLPAAKVAEHIQAIRGVPKADLLSPPTIRAFTPSRNRCRKCICPSTPPSNSACRSPSNAPHPPPRYPSTTIFSATPIRSAAASSSTASRAAPAQPTKYRSTTPDTLSSPRSANVTWQPSSKAVRARYLCGPAAASASPATPRPTPSR